jgi:steroid delta-isomerase-like uncharacterized protein
MSIEENKALVWRLTEVISEGNWPALGELLAPEFAFHNPATPSVRTGDDMAKLLMTMRSAFPPGRWTADEMVSEADKVVVRHLFRGVHSAPYRGVPPTGKEVAMEQVAVARFAGGRIVEMRVVSDTLGLLVQIGAMPAPVQPTK